MDTDDAIFDLDLDDEPGAEPDFRATVQRSGALRLVYWHEWLGRTGPVYTLIAARGRAGIGIADLTVVRDKDGLAVEVIVEFLAGGNERHRRALTSWASAAGYTRAWFDDEVVELTSSAGGLVQTRCSGCGGRFVDGRSEHFWHNVRQSGMFPSACGMCGSDMPQWTRLMCSETRAAEPAARRGDSRTATRGHSRHH
jgi:hypothetical protein